MAYLPGLSLPPLETAPDGRMETREIGQLCPTTGKADRPLKHSASAILHLSLRRVTRGGLHQLRILHAN